MWFAQIRVFKFWSSSGEASNSMRQENTTNDPHLSFSIFPLFVYCLLIWNMYELVCCQGLLNKGPRVKFIIGCQPCPCQFWQNRENAKSCWYKIAKWVFYARELLLLVDYKQNKYKIVPQISYFLFRSEKLWWSLPGLILCLHVLYPNKTYFL